MPNGIPKFEETFAIEDAPSFEETLPIEEAPPLFEETVALDVEERPSVAPPPSPQEIEQQGLDSSEPGFMEQVGRMKEASEFGLGKVMVGGFRDAAENALKTIVSLFTDPSDEPYLPEITEPESAVGQMARGAVQFGYGMAGAGKVLKPLSKFVKTGKPALDTFLKTETAALVGGQFALDPHEDRLANLIESYPSLRNPVTNYLQARPEDTVAEARLKMALEDLGVGAALEGVLTPIRFIKQGRKATARETDQSGDKLIDEQKTAVQEEQAATGDVPQPKEDIVPEETPPPAADTPKPEGPPEPDFAGNINLNRIDSPESVKDVLRETAEAHDDFLPARRGVVSNEETAKLADEMGMTNEQLLKRREGQAFNAHEALAARNMLVRSGEDLAEKAARASAEGGDEAVAAFQEALTKHAAIQEQVAGMTAEAGRALQQFRIMAEGAGRLRAMREVIERGGGDETMRTKAQMIADLAQQGDPAKLAQAAIEATRATTLDKIQEIWINGLLSGPQTHAVNMLSNALVGLWTIPENFLAAGIGKLRKGTNKVTFREGTARAFGFVQGAKEGMKAAWHTLKEGEPADIVSKIEARKHKAVPGKKGEIIRIPTRFLSAEDQFFRNIGYRMELNAQAMKQGLEEGLQGDKLAQRVRDIINNPPKELDLAATKAADYQTFMQQLGPKGVAFQKLINQQIPALRFIAPFIRTPLNILKFATERTPAAPVMKEFRDAVKAGGRERDVALARLSMGSMVGAGTAALAAEGIITGAGPSDPRAKNQMRAGGWQPYSVKVGDKYYAFNRLEPLGMLLGISADITELFRNPDISQKDKAEAEKALTLSMMGIAKNMASKTWLKGLNDLINALDDPERYGSRYVQNMIASFVPTMAAQIARTQDPTLRDARSIMDRVMTRLPGQREKLMPKRNVFGEIVTLEGGIGPDIVSPIYTSKDKHDYTISEMNRIRAFPPMPKRTINDHELTPEQYDDYSRISGETAKNMLDKIVMSPGWPKIPDDNKVDLVKRIFTKARAIARIQLIATSPELALKKK